MVRIIAHRGSSRAFPENSLSAFRNAVAHGADSLEVDLRCSSNGVIYCFHDHHLSRLTDGTGYFQRTSSGQLEGLRMAEQERILRFDDFLAEFAGKAQIVLDIKSTGIEGDILRLVSRHARKANIIFSSFDARILSRVKSLHPSAKTALILGPVRNLKIKLSIASYIVKRLTKLDCVAAHLSARIAKPRLVAKLLENGFDVAVWTVDDIVTAEKLASFGVSGIITNVPEELSRFRGRLRSRAV